MTPLLMWSQARTLIVLVIGGTALAASFAAGWRVKDWQFAKQEQARAEASLEAERLARKSELLLNQRDRKVRDDYAKNAARSRADVDAARTELEWLRLTVAVATAREAFYAGRADEAATLGKSLTECATALQEMARTADAEREQLRALQQWEIEVGGSDVQEDSK